jgi:allophanate hydrolase
MNETESLAIAHLLAQYRSGSLRPAEVVDAVYQRISGRDDHVWISTVPRESALARAKELEAQSRDLPLYGIPFAVKDCFDVAGMPTTAGCPVYAFTPPRTAPVVERLLDAGAVLIGKTNMDQFATGLVGVRSPYGVPRNPFDERYIPGGSSSGSAVAVSSGLVSFALGTDTAGSGRVPAGFGNIVGFKPTRGLLSNRGVVPACATLDCVSVLALTCADAVAVGRVAAAFDPEDPFSRRSPHAEITLERVSSFRFGIPRAEQMQFFGNPETPKLFDRARQDLEALGGVAVSIDYAPFLESALLLYNGPWVAGRWAALGDFVTAHPEAVHPVTRSILEGSKKFTAAEAFQGAYKLATLHRQVESTWKEMDTLLLPTTGTTYTIAEVEANPITLNSNLGYYTNFVNLLDCCGVAVPYGFTPARLPFGVTLIAPAWRDGLTLSLAERLHRASGLRLGATNARVSVRGLDPNLVPVAVVGAHLRGQPLNSQLTSVGARFARACRTAPEYRLYALQGTRPPKPGLVRVANGGAAMEVEVWEMPMEAFGRYTQAVPSPLAIGNIILDNSESVKGFVCEPFAVTGAQDITEFGGWRAFLASAQKLA